MGKHATDRKIEAGARRAARLTSVFAVALFALAAAPVTPGSSLFTVNSALAGNHGNAGHGRGGGKDQAPGQLSKIDESDANDGAADPADAIGAEGGGDPLPADLLPIDLEAAPANIEVIKEIAGLPDDSSLSEQEELEAIMSGWDTWRTADGPNTSTIQ